MIDRYHVPHTLLNHKDSIVNKAERGNDVHLFQLSGKPFHECIPLYFLDGLSGANQGKSDQVFKRNNILFSKEAFIKPFCNFCGISAVQMIVDVRVILLQIFQYIHDITKNIGFSAADMDISTDGILPSYKIHPQSYRPWR